MSRTPTEIRHVYKAPVPQDSLHHWRAPSTHRRAEENPQERVSSPYGYVQTPSVVSSGLPANNYVPYSVFAAYDEKYKTRPDERRHSEIARIPLDGTPSSYPAFDPSGRILAPNVHAYRRSSGGSVDDPTTAPLPAPNREQQARRYSEGQHPLRSEHHRNQQLPPPLQPLSTRLPPKSAPAYSTSRPASPSTPQSSLPVHPSIAHNCGSALAPTRHLFEQAWHQTVNNVQGEMQRMHDSLTHIILRERAEVQRLREELAGKTADRHELDVLRGQCEKIRRENESLRRALRETVDTGERKRQGEREEREKESIDNRLDAMRTDHGRQVTAHLNKMETALGALVKASKDKDKRVDNVKMEPISTSLWATQTGRTSPNSHDVEMREPDESPTVKSRSSEQLDDANYAQHGRTSVHLHSPDQPRGRHASSVSSPVTSRFARPTSPGPSLQPISPLIPPLSALEPGKQRHSHVDANSCSNRPSQPPPGNIAAPGNAVDQTSGERHLQRQTAVVRDEPLTNRTPAGASPTQSPSPANAAASIPTPLSIPDRATLAPLPKRSPTPPISAVGDGPWSPPPPTPPLTPTPTNQEFSPKPHLLGPDRKLALPQPKPQLHLSTSRSIPNNTPPWPAPFPSKFALRAQPTWPSIPNLHSRSSSMSESRPSSSSSAEEGQCSTPVTSSWSPSASPIPQRPQTQPPAVQEPQVFTHYANSNTGSPNSAQRELPPLAPAPPVPTMLKVPLSITPVAPVPGPCTVTASMPAPLPLKRPSPPQPRRAHTVHELPTAARDYGFTQRKRSRDDYEPEVASWGTGGNKKSGGGPFLAHAHTEPGRPRNKIRLGDGSITAQDGVSVGGDMGTDVKMDSPTSVSEKKPKLPGPPKTYNIGIGHMDLLYETKGDKMFCRQCKTAKDLPPAATPMSFLKTASWNDLIGHYRTTHSQYCTDLERRNPSQIAELRQRLSGSGMTGHCLR